MPKYGNFENRTVSRKLLPVELKQADTARPHFYDWQVSAGHTVDLVPLHYGLLTSMLVNKYDYGLLTSILVRPRT